MINSEFIPSKFQSAIFSAAKDTQDNLCIEAVAGSGKSTTLKEIVNLFSPQTKILCLAFNKQIAEDLKAKINHAGTKVSTINAFGFGICRNNIDDLCDIDKDKTENIAKTFFDLDDREDKNRFYKCKNSFSRLVELFRANLVKEVDESKVREIASEYGIELPSEKPEYFELVKNIYLKCLSFSSVPDFRDQIFLPIYLNLHIPQYDIVLCDESQDFDRNQMELILRAGKRIIMVGDSRQAIYAFRGAMSTAMDEMVGRIGAVRLPLSVSYRCPKTVITEAQKIVPQIEACDYAPNGSVSEIKKDEFRTKAVNGDFVLCRTTAPLVSECLAMIRAGKKATVKGREIGQQLLTVIDKIAKGEDIAIFYEKLQVYKLSQLERLSRTNNEQQIIALNDKVDTIIALAESCDNVSGIKIKISQIFSDNLVGVCFMTIHKAKGLESTRVWILCPELLPHPAANNPTQIQQELNLKYVAITRVKFEVNCDGELFWVKSEKKL